MNSKSANPIVTVWCPAYNHSRYIKQCLDGIIMQKTNFDFEVIIHDDASSDSTQKIILEYERNFPHLIRTILQKENQFSKDNLHLIKTMLQNAKGKYIAICEGDDYWTDESKLQKQFDFLENNSDYSICFHEVMVLRNDELVDDFVVWGNVKEDSTILDLSEFNYIHTPTVMYRNEKEVINYVNKITGEVLGDYILNLIFANFGKIKRLQGKWAVYRFGNGIWSGQTNEKKKNNVSINTMRNSAIILNKNYSLLESWHNYLLTKNDFQSSSFLKLNSFEESLSTTYANANLAKRIKTKDLINIFFKKLLRIF